MEVSDDSSSSGSDSDLSDNGFNDVGGPMALHPLPGDVEHAQQEVPPPAWDEIAAEDDSDAGSLSSDVSSDDGNERGDLPMDDGIDELGQGPGDPQAESEGEEEDDSSDESDGEEEEEEGPVPAAPDVEAADEDGSESDGEESDETEGQPEFDVQHIAAVLAEEPPPPPPEPPAEPAAAAPAPPAVPEVSLAATNRRRRALAPPTPERGAPSSLVPALLIAGESHRDGDPGGVGPEECTTQKRARREGGWGSHAPGTSFAREEVGVLGARGEPALFGMRGEYGAFGARGENGAFGARGENGVFGARGDNGAASGLRRASGSGSGVSGESGPAAGDALSPKGGQDWNKPGRTRNPKVLRCAACSCEVPEGFSGSGWMTHVDGIQHRRRVLALQMGVGRNETVVSVFEDTSSPRLQSGLKGKQGSGSGLYGRTGFVKGSALPEQAVSIPPAPSNANAAIPADGSARIARLCTVVMTELLGHVGRSDRSQFDAAEARLSEVQLRRSWLYVAGAVASARAAPSQLMLSVATPAQIVCLSELLPTSSISWLRVSTVACHPNDFPALTTALCLLGRALISAANLREFELTGPIWGAARASQQHEERMRVQRLWGKVLGALEAPVERRLGRLLVKLQSREEMRAGDVADLKAAGDAATMIRRLAPLMSLHKRLRAKPPLIADLPQDVLLRILNEAAPLHTPACHVSVLVQGPNGLEPY